MSLKYTTIGLTFFKINVDNFDKLTKKYNIKLDGFVVELPIVLMFKDGSEFKRYPPIDKNGNTTSARYYSKKELIKYFELDRIYSDLLSSK